jgi:hypothetical protein
MFDQFKESVLRVAREEDERRLKQAGTSAGGGGGGGDAPVAVKKKKKKANKYRHVVVNEERSVLYDFVATPQYSEQISISAGDTVFVFEMYEDGWSQVKKYSGSQGVVPTSFLAPRVVPNGTDGTTQKDTFANRIKQRLKVLGLMAIEQAKVKALSGAQLGLKTLRFFATDVVVPSARRVFLLVSRNESYTSTLSTLVRKLYEFTCASLVQSLSDEELAWYSAQVKEDSQKIKAEKDRRRAL